MRYIDQLIVCLWFLPATLSIILPLGISILWLSVIFSTDVLKGIVGSSGHGELSRVRLSGKES